MIIHKSALKRARQSLKRRDRNRALRTALRTALKKYRELLATRDAKAAEEAYVEVQRRIDKARTQGVIHANAAARYKSRLHAQMRKLKVA
ncbi:MAG: 30S ribosomal protein S20 [SAR324 cluster bacterium]